MRMSVRTDANPRGRPKQPRIESRRGSEEGSLSSRSRAPKVTGDAFPNLPEHRRGIFSEPGLGGNPNVGSPASSTRSSIERD